MLDSGRLEFSPNFSINDNLSFSSLMVVYYNILVDQTGLFWEFQQHGKLRLAMGIASDCMRFQHGVSWV